MKYMLLIYHDERALSQAERADCYAESARLPEEIHARGQSLAANRSHPTSMAISVRMRNGKRPVPNGLLAEARKQLGGYFLFRADAKISARRSVSPRELPWRGRGPSRYGR